MEVELSSKDDPKDDRHIIHETSVAGQKIIATELLEQAKSLRDKINKLTPKQLNFFVKMKLKTHEEMQNQLDKCIVVLNKINNRKVPFLVFGYDKRNKELFDIRTFFKMIEDVIKIKGGTRRRRRRSRRS